MLREEAIKILENERGYMINHAGNAQVEAFTMAIEALEQENVLDKIKADIELLNPVDYGSMFSYETHNGARDMKDDVLDIIDKYKVESEE